MNKSLSYEYRTFTAVDDPEQFLVSNKTANYVWKS